MVVHNCDDKPGIGSYQCNSCGNVIDIIDPNSALEPCPSCFSCIWNTIKPIDKNMI
ncbi:hypothetical protein MBCUT_12560 [Methanobrevibacter cuticularis]|uniref:Zinc ribbon domain protein n=1 Tax=Methanobrevibacter cuticularis TaxID=47311 RepID=A0A166DQ16_9EURY|nr:hypothetical protein [Methanobrevibacter cuticularis]KZX15836.1 hypothetical protein MBCUT_12560 [Methanobrevibacter cuticularis]